MEEFFKAIEDRLKATGYTKMVNGSDIYNEISDEIEDKENGTYIFMSHKEDEVIYEYKVDVLDDSFNLVYIRVTDHGTVYQADYDD